MRFRQPERKSKCKEQLAVKGTHQDAARWGARRWVSRKAGVPPTPSPCPAPGSLCATLSSHLPSWPSPRTRSISAVTSLVQVPPGITCFPLRPTNGENLSSDLNSLHFLKVSSRSAFRGVGSRLPAVNQSVLLRETSGPSRQPQTPPS